MSRKTTDVSVAVCFTSLLWSSRRFFSTKVERFRSENLKKFGLKVQKFILKVRKKFVLKVEKYVLNVEETFLQVVKGMRTVFDSSLS